MFSTGKAITVLLVTAAVLAGGWLTHRMISGSSGVAEPHATPNATVTPRPVSGAQRRDDAKLISALVPKRAPTKTARPPALQVKAPGDQVDLVVAEIRPAAEAGDPVAMRTLGEALNRCAGADMRTDSEIEATAAKESLDIEYLKTQGVSAIVDGESDPTRMAVKMADRKKQLRDACRKIPTDELKTASDWIKRAAARGDEGAGTDLAGRLVPRIRDQNLTVEQREEARSQMIDLLQEQIALGHCSNMVLNMFWQDSRDPMLIYIYGGILMRRGIATIDSQPPEKRETELASLQQEDRKFAAALPQDQLAAAEATRTYIEANYCRNWQG